jgi:hypothetical protein
MTWARGTAEVTAPNQRARALAAERTHDAIQQTRAAHTVAGHARDATDCRELLHMLGLDAGTARETAETE